MGIFGRLQDYVEEKEVMIQIYINKVYIINYESIPSFSNSQIVIKHKNGLITINGSNLVVSKLLKEELLVSGEIKQIELG